MPFSHLWPLFLALAAGSALWAWRLLHAAPPEPPPERRGSLSWFLEAFAGRVFLFAGLCFAAAVFLVLAAVAGGMHALGS
jgi:hypothetical protein